MFYKEFDLDNFTAIQEKLVPHVLSFCSEFTQFWNHADVTELLSVVPELETAIYHMVGQRPFKSYVLAIKSAPLDVLDTKLNGNSLHRDTSVERYRLNWPILNSTSVETRFFTSDAEPTKLILPTGETYLKYTEDQCQLGDSNTLTKPTLIDTHAIHGLYRNSDSFPRFILSFNFEKEITI